MTAAGRPSPQARSGNTPAAPEPDPLAGRIAATLLGSSTIAALVAGSSDQVTASLPGPSVPGVHLDEELVEVHVAIVYGPPLADVARDLDGLLRPLLAGRRLVIHIDDIQLPGEDLSALATTSRTEATS